MSQFYRIRAFNSVGSSNFSNIADDTAHYAPPAPDISLGATGYKVKGTQFIALHWNTQDSVDVYRNGSKRATVSGGSYEDAPGSKGGGTYEHQVCLAGSDTCSNVTTTVF